VSTFDTGRIFILVLVFVSRDFELGRNVNCEESTAELHAGPNFKIRPDPTHKNRDPTRPDPLIFPASWTRPDLTRPDDYPCWAKRLYYCTMHTVQRSLSSLLFSKINEKCFRASDLPDTCSFSTNASRFARSRRSISVASRNIAL